MEMRDEMEKLYNYFDARVGKKLKVDSSEVKLNMATQDFRDKTIKLSFDYKNRGLLSTIEVEDDYFILSTSYGTITDIRPKVKASKDDISTKIVNQIKKFVQDSDRDLKEPLQINLESFDWRE